MKRYGDCIRTDGMCGQCSLANRGLDCHNNRINGVLWQRTSAGLTQSELSVASSVNIRQIQKYESGEYNTGNMTLSTAITLADALQCGVRDLL